MVAAAFAYFFKPEYFDFIIKPSTRSIYERGLEKNPGQLARWNQLKALAFKDSIKTGNSYSENIITSSKQTFSAGYVVDIAQGESLLATIFTDTIKPSWILEAYSIDGRLQQTAVKTDSIMTLRLQNGNKQRLRIVVQSFLEKNDTTSLKIYKQPILEFPLAGNRYFFTFLHC